MTRYTLIVVALLAGCEMTPKQVMDEGEATVHVLKQPPAIAASCMARNLENAGHGVGNTAIRQIQGGVELVRATEVSTRAVVHLEPAGSGSKATVWLVRQLVYKRAEYVPMMIKGC